MKRNSADYIIKCLDDLFPNAHCELNHHNNFELLVAVILSAQTTDERVNNVTPLLFKKYPNPLKLSKASLNDVENIIKPIGLYHNKALNIIKMAKELQANFSGEVPSERINLESLPGVGRKTANVILANCFDYPAFGVDTHVLRISKRLKIASKDDNPLKAEKKLMKFFPKNKWSKLHHQFIFFGRYKCKTIKPDCDDCPFSNACDKASL